MLGGVFTLGASWLVVSASRRDRREDKLEKLDSKVDENTEDIAHISGFLEASTEYEPRKR